ncbi:hypothetical protein SDJN03_27207, partial [Cucurbita argyrosperma subsp. sororia]
MLAGSGSKDLVGRRTILHQPFSMRKQPREHNQPRSGTVLVTIPVTQLGLDPINDQWKETLLAGKMVGTARIKLLLQRATRILFDCCVALMEDGDRTSPKVGRCQDGHGT